MANPFDAFRAGRPKVNLAPTFISHPENQKSFVDKWREIGPTSVRAIGPRETKTIYELDKRRVSSGARPYTKPETARMLAAAFRKEPITEPEEGSLNPLQSIPRDLGGILTGLAHLPQAAGEAILNPQATIDTVRQGVQEGDWQKVASAPLLAFVPGVYTAGNILEGDFEEIARHPVSTALDVLPAATKAAKGTRAGKYAVRALEAEVPQPNPVRPLRAALTKKVVEHERVIEPERILPDGEVIPARTVTTESLMNNRAGELMERFGETAPAQFVRPKFGADARWLAQYARRHEATIGETALSEGPIPDEMNYRVDKRGNFVLNANGERVYHGLGDTLRRSGIELDKKWQLTPEEKVTAAKAARVRNVNSPAWQALPDKIRGYLDDVDEVTEMYTRATAPDIASLLSRYQGNLPDYLPGLEIMAKYKGEVYGAHQAAKLAKAEASATSSRQNLMVKLPRLRQMANQPGADPRLIEMVDLIDRGDLKSLSMASRLWGDMGARKVNVGRGAQAAFDEGPGVGSTDLPSGRMSINEIQNVTALFKRALQKQGAFERYAITEIPARWRDWAQERANKVAEAKIRTRFGDDVGDEAANFFVNQNYGPVFQKGWITEREFNGLIYDVSAGIRRAREAGVDPIFIHHTAPNQLKSMQWPRILPREMTPTVAQERTQSFQPYVMDNTLALTHQGIELASKLAREDFIESILDRYKMTEGELDAKYAGRGEFFRAAHPQTPDVLATRQIMERGWRKWDPQSFLGYQSARFVSKYGDDVWMPRHVVKVLDEMKRPVHEPGAIGAVWDPIMGLYRTSVLTFSPRWQLNNMLGGYIMTAATTNPVAAFKYMSRARKLMKGEEVTLKGKPVKVTQEMRASLGQHRREMSELNYSQLGAGSSLGRWFDQSFRSSGSMKRLAEMGAFPFKKVSDGSKWLNTFFDDMYRSVAYLYGYDKALTRGLHRDGAVRAGMSLVNKILPQWDALTPFERSILRSVFPFYTWTQHILRFAYNLPLDHPYRVAVTAGLLRNETSDDNTGWPQLFRSMVLVGDDDDEKTAIKLGAANPFADVSNMMTLEGFIRSMNPVLTTIAETRGIGRSGFADLFPDRDYDPVRGTLVPSTGSPLTNLLYNTIPQAEVAATLLKRTQEFDADAARDPKGARDRILQGLGIPLYWERISLAEEAAKRELDLYRAKQTDTSEGLKKGDLGEIDKWPGNNEMAAMLAQQQQLGNPMLAAYQPGSQIEAEQQIAVRQQR